MISKWETALMDYNLTELGGEVVTIVEQYSDGELEPDWYGKAWHIRTDIDVWGHRDFLMLPTGSDANTDNIMVIAVEDRSGYPRRGKYHETTERGVPYDRVLEQFKEKVGERLAETNHE